jgi:hypothetical protein
MTFDGAAAGGEVGAGGAGESGSGGGGARVAATATVVFLVK